MTKIESSIDTITLQVDKQLFTGRNALVLRRHKILTAPVEDDVITLSTEQALQLSIFLKQFYLEGTVPDIEVEA